MMLIRDIRRLPMLRATLIAAITISFFIDTMPPR